MNDTTYAIDTNARWLAYYESLEKERNRNVPDFVRERRQQAIRHVERLGFPTTRHEEWKYTNLRNLLGETFEFTAQARFSPDKIRPLLIQHADANVLVFVDGVYQPELSNTQDTELTVVNLTEAFTTHTNLVEPYYAQFASDEHHAFTALNTAFAQHGAFIHVPDKAIIQKPVLLYFISGTGSQPLAAMPRNLLIAGKNSQVQVAQLFLSAGETVSFVNQVTEIVLGENAKVDWSTIQREHSQATHIGTTQVYQQRGSRFHSVTVSLSGALVRNNLHVWLDAADCTANLYGLYVLNGSQHVDNHTLVDHAQPRSYSNELYKGILDGNSTGVFNGKILVRQDAQQTNAFQSNRNILLSKEASMNTKPQLEIFADDVKCSHGATTGQLDEDMLFYLRARGIGLPEAKKLLMYAFATDIVNQIQIEPVKQYAEQAIAEQLTP